MNTKNDMFLLQFMIGNKFDTYIGDNNTIVVTNSMGKRESHNYLWGAERYTLKICHELSKKYNVHLFISGEQCIDIDNITTHTNINTYLSRGLINDYVVKIRNIKPKCIFCNASCGQDALFWTIISKVSKIPIIMFFHNEPQFMMDTITHIRAMDYIRKQEILKDGKSLYEIVLKNCDKLAFLLPQYINEKYKEKSVVFYNCIDISNNIDIKSNRNKILYVGRINSDTKRTHILLDWVKNTDYECDVVGYSYKGFGYIDMDKYNYPNIHYYGYQENVSAFYKNADVLVVPSKYEGLPTVIIEALSYGVPIVGFKECKVMNYLIKDGYNGWLIDNNFDENMDKIMKIDKSNMRQNCLDEAKKYDINNIMKKINECIESVDDEN